MKADIQKPPPTPAMPPIGEDTADAKLCPVNWRASFVARKTSSPYFRRGARFGGAPKGMTPFGHEPFIPRH